MAWRDFYYMNDRHDDCAIATMQIEVFKFNHGIE